MILDGVVKNITDYGAFVDLGGVDGLLHVTDVAWRRINHPSEALQIGQQVRVQVIRFNAETQRISLGMKQLEADPWEGVAAKYPPGAKYTGRVTNITDYGAFVELEPGVEGLVHVSEMSWTKKNVHPGKIVSTSQEVEVMVLDVDSSKRRISLGLKQVQRNPWEEFTDTHPVGAVVEGEIRNITEFGLFIGLSADIDGMVHMSDISWDEPGELAMAKYEKGQIVSAKVLDVDVEKERISLGIKQLADDPAADTLSRVHKGEVVTCVVTAVQANGIEVKVDEVLTGFIRRAELARDKGDQRPDRFAVGEKVDAKITAIDRAARKLSLTIKGREIEEDKQAVAEFGTSDSGASLGDILGAAIRRRNQQSASKRGRLGQAASKRTCCWTGGASSAALSFGGCSRCWPLIGARRPAAAWRAGGVPGGGTSAARERQRRHHLQSPADRGGERAGQGQLGGGCRVAVDSPGGSVAGGESLHDALAGWPRPSRW